MTKTTYTHAAELIAAGWNISMAEALSENGHTVETAKLLSTEEAFDLFLTWNGVIGYTVMIRDALDNCRNMEGGEPAAPEFVDNLPLDGRVMVHWKDREPEEGIYRGYLVGKPRRCAVLMGSSDLCGWVDREIITPIERTE